MGSIENLIGEPVVIEWEPHAVVQFGRDPIDPDSWKDYGFLAYSGSGYGLAYFPNSFEFQKGDIGIHFFEEEDVNCINKSVLNVNRGVLGQQTSTWMVKYGMNFGMTVSVPLQTHQKFIPQTTNLKNCSTCSHSNLLNLVCKKQNKYLSDLKGTCSEWKD